MRNDNSTVCINGQKSNHWRGETQIVNKIENYDDCCYDLILWHRTRRRREDVESRGRDEENAPEAVEQLGGWNFDWTLLLCIPSSPSSFFIGSKWRYVVVLREPQEVDQCYVIFSFGSGRDLQRRVDGYLPGQFLVQYRRNTYWFPLGICSKLMVVVTGKFYATRNIIF